MVRAIGREKRTCAGMGRTDMASSRRGLRAWQVGCRWQAGPGHRDQGMADVGRSQHMADPGRDLHVASGIWRVA